MDPLDENINSRMNNLSVDNDPLPINEGRLIEQRHQVMKISSEWSKNFIGAFFKRYSYIWYILVITKKTFSELLKLVFKHFSRIVPIKWKWV